MSKKLTSMQAAFCRHYTSGMTGAEAARAAGYAPKYADRQASKLQGMPHIQAEIKRLNALLEDEAIMTAREVLKRWTSIARGEGSIPRSTPTGIHELPPDWPDRLRALQELAKYHSLSAERRIISFEKPPSEMSDAELLEAMSALSNE